MEEKTKARRGFACMTPERRQEIARKGGASVPAEKRSYSQDRELAARAGKLGGQISKGGGRPGGLLIPVELEDDSAD